MIGSDPVMFGFVASLNRPGGNITGMTLFGIELATKRLGLLLELVPAATIIGVLANPKLLVLKASAESDFATVSTAIGQQHIDALVVAADPFFDDRRTQIVSMAARQKVPACYVRHEFVREGGLISYGADAPDQFRQAGIYTGRILKGEKPADLPVMQPSKFELALNLKAAKALGLTVPSTLIARVDEVIE